MVTDVSRKNGDRPFDAGSTIIITTLHLRAERSRSEPRQGERGEDIKPSVNFHLSLFDLPDRR